MIYTTMPGCQRTHSKLDLCNLNMVNLTSSRTGQTGLRPDANICSVNLRVCEWFFWLLSFSIAAGASGWFILNVYEEWQSNPVIMGYGPHYIKINELPFPAITVCSLDMVKRDVAKHIANKRLELQ